MPPGFPSTVVVQFALGRFHPQNEATGRGRWVLGWARVQFDKKCTWHEDAVPPGSDFEKLGAFRLFSMGPTDLKMRGDTELVLISQTLSPYVLWDACF